MLNNKGLSYHEEHGLPVLRILTYRGTEYCGHADQHDDQLFLAINMIGHTRTKVKSSQTNGLYERVHKTMLQEVYQVTCRKKIYGSVKHCKPIWGWIHWYNTDRTHQGKMCLGRPRTSL